MKRIILIHIANIFASTINKYKLSKKDNTACYQQLSAQICKVEIFFLRSNWWICNRWLLKFSVNWFHKLEVCFWQILSEMTISTSMCDVCCYWLMKIYFVVYNKNKKSYLKTSVLSYFLATQILRCLKNLSIKNKWIIDRNVRSHLNSFNVISISSY